MLSKGNTVKAQFYERVGRHTKIRCLLCPHRCLIEESKKGICKVRVNQEGTLYSEIYGKVSSAVVEPIEKRPFYHFWPGSLALTISSVGCNMQCRYCQNWQISQAPVENLVIPHMTYTPEDIIAIAEKNQCPSIAFAYNEPIIWFEFIKDVGIEARKRGLKILLVTNGYISSDVVDELSPLIDAVNIDLKAFNDRFYRKICGVPSRKPILDTVVRFKDKGVHLELSHLLIPGQTDTLTDIRQFSEWVKENLGGEIPVHFLAFFPAFKMLNVNQTPVETLNNAQKIAKSIGIKYSYIGNLRGSPGENTHCPQCGDIIIKRQDFSILEYAISSDHRCNKCKQEIPITGKYTEHKFPWRKSFL
jgi:pyruvate formate lyase activating enzyme